MSDISDLEISGEEQAPRPSVSSQSIVQRIQNQRQNPFYRSSSFSDERYDEDRPPDDSKGSVFRGGGKQNDGGRDPQTSTTVGSFSSPKYKGPHGLNDSVAGANRQKEEEQGTRKRDNTDRGRNPRGYHDGNPRGTWSRGRGSNYSQGSSEYVQNRGRNYLNSQWRNDRRGQSNWRGNQARPQWKNREEQRNQQTQNNHFRAMDREERYGSDMALSSQEVKSRQEAQVQREKRTPKKKEEVYRGHPGLEPTSSDDEEMETENVNFDEAYKAVAEETVSKEVEEYELGVFVKRPNRSRGMAILLKYIHEFILAIKNGEIFKFKLYTPTEETEQEVEGFEAMRHQKALHNHEIMEDSEKLKETKPLLKSYKAKLIGEFIKFTEHTPNREFLQYLIEYNISSERLFMWDLAINTAFCKIYTRLLWNKFEEDTQLIWEKAPYNENAPIFTEEEIDREKTLIPLLIIVLREAGPLLPLDLKEHCNYFIHNNMLNVPYLTMKEEELLEFLQLRPHIFDFDYMGRVINVKYGIRRFMPSLINLILWNNKLIVKNEFAKCMTNPLKVIVASFPCGFEHDTAKELDFTFLTSQPNLGSIGVDRIVQEFLENFPTIFKVKKEYVLHGVDPMDTISLNTCINHKWTTQVLPTVRKVPSLWDSTLVPMNFENLPPPRIDRSRILRSYGLITFSVQNKMKAFSITSDNDRLSAFHPNTKKLTSEDFKKGQKIFMETERLLDSGFDQIITKATSVQRVKFNRRMKVLPKMYASSVGDEVDSEYNYEVEEDEDLIKSESSEEEIITKKRRIELEEELLSKLDEFLAMERLVMFEKLKGFCSYEFFTEMIKARPHAYELLNGTIPKRLDKEVADFLESIIIILNDAETGLSIATILVCLLNTKVHRNVNTKIVTEAMMVLENILSKREADGLPTTYVLKGFYDAGRRIYVP